MYVFSENARAKMNYMVQSLIVTIDRWPGVELNIHKKSWFGLTTPTGMVLVSSFVAIWDAKNEDGSQKYPFDVRMNCHVTKVTFDEFKTPSPCHWC